MNMSMDKPIALSNTEGTRGLQVKKCKNDVKKAVPGHGNENMNMSMDKPIALNRTEGRSPKEKWKKRSQQKEVPRAWELKYEHVHGQTDSSE